MTSETWLLYLGTLIIFMSTPGPSHLLMLSVSVSNGFQRSLATAAGDLTANVIQIMLAGLGLAAVVTASRYGFEIVKWAGVAYLIWVGTRQIIRSFSRDIGEMKSPRASARQLWFRGFVTSAANPKAVVFFAALFPQFLDTQSALAPQIAILGTTYIVVDGAFLAAYGKGGSWIADKIESRFRPWIDRIAGTGLIGAAVWLGFRETART